MQDMHNGLQWHASEEVKCHQKLKHAGRYVGIPAEQRTCNIYVQRGNWQTLPCCITLSLQKVITNFNTSHPGLYACCAACVEFVPMYCSYFCASFFFSVLYHPGMWHKDEVDFCVTCPALVLSHTPLLQAMDYIIQGFKDRWTETH